ncbi:MAG: nucleotidyl transferase AbiEii/AbiGii toxin family protein [Thermoplasmataceae archaeon]
MKPIASMISGARLELAEMQDLVIDIIYNDIEPEALLYGGTAIWRCYGGGRFSEDLDIYMKNKSIETLISSLPKYGLKLLWSDDDFPTNIRIGNNQSSLLIESKEGYAENQISQYLRVDGSSITISVFSPTELLVRKIEAYQGRCIIRDIYDIFILSRYLDRNDYTVRSTLISFLKNIKAPVDQGILSSLIYVGISNISFQEMIDYLWRWLLNEI